MNNTKFSWKGYWEPTPKGIRKIADSLLAGGMLIATFSVFADRPKFGVVDGVGVNVGVVVGLAVFVGERVGVVVGLLVTVGVFVGVLVRVGVTLLVGVGVIKITSPSMHPLLSSILMTIFV